MNSKTQNILRNLGFLLSIPVIIMAFVFAVAEDKRATVKSIEVEILNPVFGFVTSQVVERSLMDENLILNYSSIELLNVSALEEKINSNPWVDYAEVYVTSAQSVKVKLMQVNPKLRVQRTDSTSNGYYLDDNGFMFPLSRSYSADLPILTSERRITSIDQRKELVQLAQFIEQDTFWQATISQINLDKNGDIELVSLVGDANIRFGSVENMEDKFFRLFQFYKKGINRINWSNVKELDVRFSNQLVCRRFHKEQHIEEAHAPKLYVKTKTKPAETLKKQMTKLPVVKIGEPKKEVSIPERRKVVSKRAWKSEAIVESISNSPKKNVSTKVEADKMSSLNKVESIKLESKKSLNEKKAKEAVDQPIQPKAKNKKRVIVINTEPITSKKATQK